MGPKDSSIVLTTCAASLPWWDKKQQKTFVSRHPKLTAKIHTAATVQEAWCFQFHAHVGASSICVHNHFDFCKLTNNPEGFTCGDDAIVQQHDAPLLLKPKLCLWSLLIHAALQAAFPLTGTNKCCIVQRQHGLGCEALFDLI